MDLELSLLWFQCLASRRIFHDPNKTDITPQTNLNMLVMEKPFVSAGLKLLRTTLVGKGNQLFKWFYFYILHLVHIFEGVMKPPIYLKNTKNAESQRQWSYKYEMIY